jgi:hypothetical protein
MKGAAHPTTRFISKAPEKAEGAAVSPERSRSSSRCGSGRSNLPPDAASPNTFYSRPS